MRIFILLITVIFCCFSFEIYCQDKIKTVAIVETKIDSTNFQTMLNTRIIEFDTTSLVIREHCIADNQDSVYVVYYDRSGIKKNQVSAKKYYSNVQLIIENINKYFEITEILGLPNHYAKAGFTYFSFNEEIESINFNEFGYVEWVILEFNGFKIKKEYFYSYY